LLNRLANIDQGRLSVVDFRIGRNRVKPSRNGRKSVRLVWRSRNIGRRNQVVWKEQAERLYQFFGGVLVVEESLHGFAIPRVWLAVQATISKLGELVSEPLHAPPLSFI